MPTSVSRLLEEAVRFLDTSQTSKQGDVKESLENILGTLKEVAAQRETGAEGERISELRQLLEQVGGNIREEGSRVQGLEEKQNMLVMEVKGLGDDIKRNFERMEKFCQEESQSRQKWQQKYDNLSFLTWLIFQICCCCKLLDTFRRLYTSIEVKPNSYRRKRLLKATKWQTKSVLQQPLSSVRVLPKHSRRNTV